MRVLSRFLIAFAALVATFAAPTAALADPYPIGEPASQVSDATVSDGGAVIFSGAGFGADEMISIAVAYNGDSQRQLKMVRAEADGSFSTSVTLTEQGTAVLTATGVESGVVVTSTVQVVEGSGDGAGNGNGSLPTTGPGFGDIATTVYGGIAFALIGAGLLWSTRRRRPARR